LCRALLFSLRPLALYSGGEIGGRCRGSRAGDWRRGVWHPGRRRLLNALALHCGRRRLLNALSLYNRPRSGSRSGSYSGWRWCCLSPLVLSCGLDVRWLSRFSFLAGRGFRVRLFPLLGRLRILLFSFFALRIRCCACADHQ
jgi:hypothetical protein